MDRLDSLSTYFKEKERKKLNNMVKNTNNGIPIMSSEEIKLSCIENNGYETPELNDKLYLHFRGFKRIENLGPYTGCKAIWLDSNGFDKVEGLSTLSELRCLYLGKNLLHKIEGLESLVNLHTIDLSYNRITTVENLSCCPNLKTVILARNALTTAASIAHLAECPQLECIDLTNNQLNGADVMVELAKISTLLTLSISGNEITKLPGFRKTAIVNMPRLGYLDRPIDELERICANAFISGGQEAEQLAREEYREQQKKKRVNEALAFRVWQKEQAEIRKQQVAEGRTFYTEFTEAERIEREQSAERAWREEQQMLQKGIDKLTARSWDHIGEDVPENDEEGGESDELGEARVEELPADETTTAPSLENSAITDASPRDLSVPSTLTPQPVAVSPEDEEQAVIDALLQKAKAMELAEQQERDQRVTESLAIFKRQREAEKLKQDKENKLSSLSNSNNASANIVYPRVSMPSTWDNALNAPDDPPKPFRVTLYWTLEMDLRLATLVRDCVFDFDKIFLKMISAATDGAFGDMPKPSIALLSSEACRLRWSELDATQWSELAPNATSTDAVYKICIDPADVTDGKVQQLSFDNLAAKAVAGIPKYLIPPTVFPSVRDGADESDDEESEEDNDDDDEDEDVLDLRSIALQMKNRQ